MNSTVNQNICAVVARELKSLGVLVRLGRWTLEDSAERVPVVIVYGVPDESLREVRRRVMAVFAREFPGDEPWPILTVHTASDCAVGGACHVEYLDAMQAQQSLMAVMSAPFVWVGNDPLDRSSSDAIERTHGVSAGITTLGRTPPAHRTRCTPPSRPDFGIAA